MATGGPPLAWFALAVFTAVAAANGSTVDDAYAEGRQAYKTQDYVRAMKILQPLAQAGHPGAQFYVGQMYENGQGVAQDPAQTLEWYRRSAEAGYAKSQYKLAAGYARGWPGLEKNEVEAGKWLLKAAQGGYRTAQRVLSKAYEKGVLGFPRDPAKAKYWWDQAHAGSADSEKSLK